MTRDRLIERLAGRQSGRRGFGDTADPFESAAFREVLRGDHDLNPDMISPPSTALRPAAVLVPLVDHPGGMSVLLTQERFRRGMPGTIGTGSDNGRPFRSKVRQARFPTGASDRKER